jgi:CNT family concentrative nucleoside transporter
MIPIAFVWKNVVQRVTYLIPERLRLPVGAFGSIAVILVGTFVSEETADNTRANRAVSLFGLLVFLFMFWATSKNRRLINWHTVIVGMLAQFVLAVFVLRTQAGVSPLFPTKP